MKIYNGTLQPKNPIEEIVPYLPETGDKLLKLVDEIERAKDNIITLQKRIRENKKMLREKRSEAKVMITRNYVESEVETADVMATRTKQTI